MARLQAEAGTPQAYGLQAEQHGRSPALPSQVNSESLSAMAVLVEPRRSPHPPCPPGSWLSGLGGGGKGGVVCISQTYKPFECWAFPGTQLSISLPPDPAQTCN